MSAAAPGNVSRAAPTNTKGRVIEIIILNAIGRPHKISRSDVIVRLRLCLIIIKTTTLHSRGMPIADVLVLLAAGLGLSLVEATFIRSIEPTRGESPHMASGSVLSPYHFQSGD